MRALSVTRPPSPVCQANAGFLWARVTLVTLVLYIVLLRGGRVPSLLLLFFDNLFRNISVTSVTL